MTDIVESVLDVAAVVPEGFAHKTKVRIAWMALHHMVHPAGSHTSAGHHY